MNRYAVIMAGGRGERFWPESRSSRPKQFLTLTGNRSMIQQSVDRISSMIPPDHVFVVLGQTHLELAKEQLPEIPEENLLVEPVGRNTAPCIGLAAVHIHRRDPNGVMLVFPADHLIQGQSDFLSCLDQCFDWASKGDNLVTIGISPSRPETGYGYIEREDHAIDTGPFVYEVRRFVEKPDAEKATAFLQTGRFYWNSGIFIWKAETILNRIMEHLPELSKGLIQIASCIGTEDEADVLNEVFPSLPAISVDYGIMEKSPQILMVQGDFGWDDLGSWGALASIGDRDARGMNTRGTFVGHDNDDCFVYCDQGLVAALGVENLIIVKSGDVVMVCDKNRTQEVRELVRLCKENELHRYL
jgi:mannose-1-phosphate guanylyltransferase